MHILFLVNNFPPGGPIGGIVTYTELMAKAWRLAGHQVSVVCHSMDGQRHEQQQEGIRVVKVPARPYPGALLDKLYFGLMGDNSRRLLFHREFSYAVLQEVELWPVKPDLVESPEAFAWGWHLQRAGYPVVVRVHGPNRLAREADPSEASLRTRCLEDAEWEFMRDARGVFPATQYMKGVLEGWGLRVEPPIPLPLDISKCRGAACCALPDMQMAPGNTGVAGYAPTKDDCHRLISVGRVIAGKGFDTPIRVVAALGDPWTLDIVGPEGMPGAVQALRSLARELGVESRVVFSGALSHDEVLRRMSTARALIHDSRNDNMPYVVLEAMAMGTRVLASSVGGTPETLGACGRLLAPGDVKGYVEALRALPAGRDQDSIEFVRKKHDPIKIQQLCEQAYQR